MFEQSFSKIWLLVIAAVIIAAGVLILQQLQAPTEKGQPSGEKAEAPQEEAQPPADETADLLSTASATEGWETYRNEEYGYELKYPSNWVLNETRFGEDSKVFEAPTKTPSPEELQELQELFEAGKEAEFKTKGQQYLQLVVPFFKVTFMQKPPVASFSKYITDIGAIKIKDLVIDGYDAVQYTTVTPPEGGEEHEYMAVVMIKDEYWILIDAIDATQIFNQVLLTFRFLE